MEEDDDDGHSPETMASGPVSASGSHPQNNNKLNVEFAILGSTNSPHPGHAQVTDFVIKLYNMLEEPEISSMVCWSTAGGSFVVKDPIPFSEIVLSRHFKHSNFSSFVRQLNKYGFSKVKQQTTDDGRRPYGNEAWEFRHPDFHRDDRERLERIRRKIPGAKKSRKLAMQKQQEELLQQQQQPHNHPPNLYGHEHESGNGNDSISSVASPKPSASPSRIQSVAASQYTHESSQPFGVSRVGEVPYFPQPNFANYGMQHRASPVLQPNDTDLQTKMQMTPYTMHEIPQKSAILPPSQPSQMMHELPSHGMPRIGATNFNDNTNGNTLSAIQDTQQSQRLPSYRSGFTNNPFGTVHGGPPLPAIVDIPQRRQLQVQPTFSVSQQQENVLSDLQEQVEVLEQSHAHMSNFLRELSTNYSALVGEVVRLQRVSAVNEEKAQTLTSQLDALHQHLGIRPHAPHQQHGAASTLAYDTAHHQQDERRSSDPRTQSNSPSKRRQAPVDEERPINKHQKMQIGPQITDSSQTLLFADANNPRRTTLGAEAIVVPKWRLQPNVLLVEDDVVCRKLSSRLLQMFGCTFETAIDGLAAINSMTQKNYDLVLMDIVMPNLDGLSATCRIREFDTITPIIAMTSNITEKDCMTYLALGMNDILGKPFSKFGLFRMLERYCQHLKATANPDNEDNDYGNGSNNIPEQSHANKDQISLYRSSEKAGQGRSMAENNDRHSYNQSSRKNSNNIDNTQNVYNATPHLSMGVAPVTSSNKNSNGARKPAAAMDIHNLKGNPAQISNRVDSYISNQFPVPTPSSSESNSANSLPEIRPAFSGGRTGPLSPGTASSNVSLNLKSSIYDMVESADRMHAQISGREDSAEELRQ